jgi:transcriptional regulator with XRE-family HTH domain
MSSRTIHHTALRRSTTPEPERSPADAIRQWREAKGLSQLRLATRAGVSTRHISFIESGRSDPGREVIIRIGRALELTLRDQNELLVAAGFAPLHPPRRLSDESMSAVRDVFEFLLERHEPNSAVVIDRSWNVIMRNRAHIATMRLFAPDSRSAAGEPANLVEEVFDPASLRPSIANFDLVATLLYDRLQQMASAGPRRPDVSALIERIASFGPIPARPAQADLPRLSLLMPIVFRRGELRMSVFSTTTGFTAPLDATAQELQLETFFPADPESEDLLRRLRSERRG